MKEENLLLIEYRLLWDRVKSTADIKYRELQLIAALLAAFVVLVGSDGGMSILDKWWVYGLIQGILFIILLIHASRLVYLSLVRKHMRELEYKLSDGENKLSYESEVIYRNIAPRKSLSWQIDFILLLIYLLIFLCFISLSIWKMCNSNYLYYIGVFLELIIITYVAVRLVKGFKP